MNKTDNPEGVASGRQANNQPARIVKDDISVYYSNCAMVGTSPVDLCVYFGRFGQTTDNNQQPLMAEIYEKQIYMTVDQARRLAAVLSQTLQSIDASQAGDQHQPGQQQGPGQRPATRPAQQPQTATQQSRERVGRPSVKSPKTD